MGEEEKISLPNYLFLSPLNFQRKESARRKKLKREIMNPERERMLQMAELQAMKDVLNSLLDVCHPRCIDKSYHDNKLTSNELICVDQCSKKFMNLHGTVGELMMKQARREDMIKAANL